MRPRITVITVGVDDLERSLRFYRDGLGLPTPGIIGTEFEHGAVAFFDPQAGVKLALWPRRSISHDSGIPASPPSPTEFTLGHNVSSKQEVDAVMEQAAKAGAKIVKQGARGLARRVKEQDMASNPYERFKSGDLILRDELAVDRTVLANERTLLSYIRTGLAFAVTGAGTIKFFASLTSLLLGWCMVASALVVTAVGVWRFRRVAGHIATCRKPGGV